MESQVRPTITVPDAISICDAIRAVVVYNTLHGKPIDEKTIETLMMHEYKLTSLVTLANTRAAMKALKPPPAS